MSKAVGSCPCTGVMGIGLGAGIGRFDEAVFSFANCFLLNSGRLQGMYGYFMDNIVELTFVLYDGSVKTLSPTENTELWWAARGAGKWDSLGPLTRRRAHTFLGHNFGVAVEAVVRTYPQLNDGMHFVADMEYPVSSTEDIFKWMNEISTPDLPPELAFFITAHYRGKSGKVSLHPSSPFLINALLQGA